MLFYKTSDDLGKPGNKMGGCGSGWQGSKKTTVEDSLCLSDLFAREEEGARDWLMDPRLFAVVL